MTVPGNDTARFWKKEYSKRQHFNRMTTSVSNKYGEELVASVVKEYARYCTLHGIQYVFKENASFVERAIWFGIVLSSFVSASLLMNTMWTRFSLSPTMTAVKDTHLPLYSLPFPAVSICSTDKIKRTAGYSYISRYINLSEPEMLKGVDNFLIAMSLFQHPHYSRSTPYLKEAATVSNALSTINLTDFMLNVSRKCDDIFNRCFWIGQAIDCCHLFKFQRTEEGFCYSFNSLTSYFDDKCHSISAVGSYSEADSKLMCMLQRNTAAGSSSGLEIFLKQINNSDRIVYANESIGVPGHRVQVFYVSEYPEAGMGSLVESEKAVKLSLTIKPSVTISTEAIRHLVINDRFCYFPDEQQLSVSYSYSQKSCLIECRLKHVEQVCHCRPYYFNLMDDSVPICNSIQIDCIAEHNSELVFFSPPSVDIRGFNDSDSKSLLNCSQCLPTCHESVYDIDTSYTTDTQPLAQHSYGALDIFYRNEGAVKYQRDVTFGTTDLLVSFGGIAGLFLGFSLLSIVEFAYWSIKLTLHQLSTYLGVYTSKTKKRKRRRKQLEKQKKIERRFKRRLFKPTNQRRDGHEVGVSCISMCALFHIMV